MTRCFRQAIADGCREDGYGVAWAAVNSAVRKETDTGCIRLREEAGASEAEWRALLVDGARVFIDLPFRHLGRTGNTIDIAHDFLAITFMAEELGRRAQAVGLDDAASADGIVVELRGVDVAAAARFLAAHDVGFTGRDARARLSDNDVDDRVTAFSEQVFEFEIELRAGRALRFPLLADEWYANVLAAREDDGLATPPYRWSFISSAVGFDVFAGDGFLATTIEADPLDVIAATDWRDAATGIMPAVVARVDDREILITDQGVYPTPKAVLGRARKCFEAVGLSRGPARSPFHYLVSPDGSLCVARAAEGIAITFSRSPTVLGVDAMRSLLARLDDTRDRVVRLMRGDPAFRCDWRALDDEAFELLCHELVARADPFDPETLRKMGKSRSRDGGRDLEAWTRALPRVGGNGREKWIFQCKLVRGDRAVTGAMVEVVDLVHQHGAKGIGIITSGLIDATLYDKLDALERNHGVRHLAWGRPDVERRLAIHRDLRLKFFGG